MNFYAKYLDKDRNYKMAFFPLFFLPMLAQLRDSHVMTPENQDTFSPFES